MDRKKVVIAVVLVLVVTVGAAWALGFFGGDPVVAELQQMRQQMFANRDLPDAERQQLREQFRARMDGLTDAQRDALRRDGRDRWQGFAQQRMDEFFALPPAQQRDRLDEIIDRMVQRQHERQQNPTAGRNRGGGGGRNLTDAQRDARSKQRLDRVDPKMRAQFTEFRKRLDDRMRQRGLPPGEGRGPGRGGWGGFGRGAA